MPCLKVAYAKKDLNADIVLDMATLTGAQGVATGKHHASLLTNEEAWEPACAAAGKASGDLVVSTVDMKTAFLPFSKSPRAYSDQGVRKNNQEINWGKGCTVG